MNISTTLNIFLKPSPLTIKQLNQAMQRAAEHRDVCEQALAVVENRLEDKPTPDDLEIAAAFEHLSIAWGNLEKFCQAKLEGK